MTRWAAAFGIIVGCSSPVEATAPLAGAEPTASDHDLSWLLGCWRSQDQGVVTLERWRRTSHGLVGENQSTRDGAVIHREDLTIRRTAEGITLTALPQGQARTVFEAIEVTERRITFANPGHDYPQRIIYTSHRDDQMRARIEGSKDGIEKSSEWKWTRAVDPWCDEAR